MGRPICLAPAPASSICLFDFFKDNINTCISEGVFWNEFEHNALLMNQAVKGFMNIRFLADVASEANSRNVMISTGTFGGICWSVNCTAPTAVADHAPDFHFGLGQTSSVEKIEIRGPMVKRIGSTRPPSISTHCRCRRPIIVNRAGDHH